MTTSLDMNIVESQQVANSTGQLKMTSTRQKIVKRFFRHRLALVGLFILVFLYGSAFLADLISPYGMNSAEISHSHFPPSQIHRNHEGSFKGPFIYHVRKKLILGEICVCRSTSGTHLT